MTYGEATKILAASAACQLKHGCNICPLYADLIDAGRLEGYCAELTSPERTREAIELIHQTGALERVGCFM